MMRFKSSRPPILLLLVSIFLLACIPTVCNAGRLPDNPANIFEMQVDEDDSMLMNGDTQEQKILKQFEEQQFQKFKEDQEKKERQKKEEEEERINEKEEEEERKRDEEAKRERERKKEERRLKEEKEEREEHERRQKELKEIERKRKEKEEEDKKNEEQREHNKQWRDKHEGRKKVQSKQEKWQQQQAEEAELARKKFEESFDDETEAKKKEEAEAAELRVLEPHIETHTKKQKEELKELEENREEHTDELIDRLNPDVIIHAGEEPQPEKEKEKKGEDHKEEDGEECDEDCQKEKAEKEAAELKAKLAQEAEELSVLEPHVQIHNKQEKKMEELMKDKPFVAGDIEAAVHGGGHVHEDKDEDEPEAVGIKVVDELKDALKKDDEEKGEIGAEDPEHLMHGGGDHDHGAKDKKDAPGLAVPGDVQDHGGDFAHDDSRAAKKKTAKTDDKVEPGIGMDQVEKAIHGEFLAHDYTNDKKPGPGKVITKEDIVKLGLSKEMLKGVDLTKLLAKDQREYERFQNGEDDDDDDDDEENKNSFWGQMSRIRKEYLDSLASRIRNIGMPDMENAEWDKHDLDDREMPTAEKGALKPGESSLEHQMESWGSSGGKGKEGNAKFAPKIGEVP